MTRKELEPIIFKAIELLPQQGYSCFAIRKAGGKAIENEYIKFLGAWWPWKNSNVPESAEDTRIISLLLFMEVKLDDKLPTESVGKFM